jgi:hypothetical protein
MESFLQIIIEVGFYYFLSYPGAYIVWIFSRNKCEFKNILKVHDNTTQNGAVGMLVFSLLILTFVIIYKFIFKK